MKNKSVFLPALIAVFFFIASCKKEQDHHDNETVTSKVIDVTLNQNQSYSYTMQSNGDADNVMEISQQAQHALTCKISADGSRNTLFEYTPALDYTGSDEIQVNTIEDKQKDGNHGGNHGNCQGGHENDSETNYIFKITIVSSAASEVH
ncbi:MAG: hypothetical protein ABIT08_11855 [Bacteroidia bacterium]